MSEPDNGIYILIADDDPVVLSALAMGLSSMGFRVEKAASGEEAVYKCLQLHPTIAVLDINMPGISGIEAARQIRETSAVPVMFLSAYDEQALVDQAVAEGGLGYLVKPIRINQLVPAIQAALARAAELGQLESSRQHLTQALEGDRNINIAMGILMERHRLLRGAARPRALRGTQGGRAGAGSHRRRRTAQRLRRARRREEIRRQDAIAR